MPSSSLRWSTTYLHLYLGSKGRYRSKLFDACGRISFSEVGTELPFLTHPPDAHRRIARIHSLSTTLVGALRLAPPATALLISNISKSHSHSLASVSEALVSAHSRWKPSPQIGHSVATSGIFASQEGHVLVPILPSRSTTCSGVLCRMPDFPKSSTMQSVLTTPGY